MTNDVAKTRRSFRRHAKPLTALAMAALFAAAVTTLVTTAPARDEKPKTTKVVVPFQMLATNHMVLSARINGKGPYELIFDLGAPISLLSNFAAEDAGVINADEPRSLFGIRGEKLVSKLELGELSEKKVPVVILD